MYRIKASIKLEISNVKQAELDSCSFLPQKKVNRTKLSLLPHFRHLVYIKIIHSRKNSSEVGLCSLKSTGIKQTGLYCIV